MECLQYAHAHDCPWDWESCAEAAEGGHWACYQYAHEYSFDQYLRKYEISGSRDGDSSSDCG